MKIAKLPPDAIEYLKHHGTHIVTEDGSQYFHLPEWFNETDQEGVYVVLQQDKLPRQVKDIFRRMNGEPLTIEEALERLLTEYSQDHPAITAKYLYEVLEFFQHAVREIKKP